MRGAEEAVATRREKKNGEKGRLLIKFYLIIPVYGIHDAKELGGAGDRLKNVVSAWEWVYRAEDALVELFVIYNKSDAAFAAVLRDKESRAAPCGWSRNISNDVLLQQHGGDGLGFFLLSPGNSTCCGDIKGRNIRVRLDSNDHW